MSERENAGHGIRIGVVLATLGMLAGVTMLVALVMHALAVRWHTPFGGANVAMDLRIPGPDLEAAPQYDSARSVTENQRLLTRYEWIDRGKGIARIPIESAMRILAGESTAGETAPKQPPQGQPDRDAQDPSARVSGPITMTYPAVAQRPGGMLPLDTHFTDERGRAASLAEYFGRGPVVLVFGYYRCPNLCSTLMENVLVSLSAASIAAGSYDIVSVSVDPREDARDAAVRGRMYRAAYGDLPLHLLTGSAGDSQRLADAAGVRYAYDPETGQYAHPLALLVVAPDGRVSRYFAGVQFDPPALRLALVEAADGRIGTLTDRIFLRCAHYDPRTGRYTVASMSFVRGGSLVLASSFGVWLWRRRKTRARSPGAHPAGRLE